MQLYEKDKLLSNGVLLHFLNSIKKACPVACNPLFWYCCCCAEGGSPCGLDFSALEYVPVLLLILYLG